MVAGGTGPRAAVELVERLVRKLLRERGQLDTVDGLPA